MTHLTNRILCLLVLIHRGVQAGVQSAFGLIHRASLIFSLDDVLTLEMVSSHIDEIGYDDNQWPTFELRPARPTKVLVDIFINSFETPMAATMDYRMDVFLRQSWVDPRLRSTGNFSQVLTVSNRKVIDRLWVPDVYFLNLKDAKYHDITMPNVLMRIYGDGSVFYSMRLKLLLSCVMDLRKFPLDTQVCPIKISTYAHPMEALLFEWRNGGQAITHDMLEIPQFSLEAITTDTPDVLHFHTGNFSTLSASFRLTRENGYHILQTYIPTVLIVAMSWVSFWLEQTATPARVTLGVTTLLTLTSLASGVRTELPPVSYLKAMDVWVGTCMIFVFGALLEFVIVHYLAKKRKHSRDYRRSFKEMFFSGHDSEFSLQQPSRAAPVPAKPKQTYIAEAKVVDRVCRVLIPGAFLMFNIAYWCIYAL